MVDKLFSSHVTGKSPDPVIHRDVGINADKIIKRAQRSDLAAGCDIYINLKVAMLVSG